MADDYEGEVCCIEVAKLILPGEIIKTRVLLDHTKTVCSEKERLLRDAQIDYSNKKFVMLAIGTQNSRTVLEDDKIVISYAECLGTDVEIEIIESRPGLENTGVTAKPENFGVSMK
ncbi:uncharacterized protein LOC131948943 [Physella acuta]|uniref:uncharacterized protein LOC131948943 n=1 Tax=Physella acuta TaxID=109671 RepID=UPI0027DB818F|nr:uncharacterized protein LOC131948943 [Physella acuta]